MITHILFDFFGTLVEYSDSLTSQGYERSYRLVAQAGADLDYEAYLTCWSTVFGAFEQDAESTLREFSMTDVATEFLMQTLNRPPSSALVSEFVRVYLSEWNKGVCYPLSMQELLERLANRYDLAIVTNTHDADLVPGHLGRMEASGYFQSIVTSVGYGVRKPHPAIFEHTLKTLGASAEACVYVGDNYETDYEGALSAGIRALLIDPGQHHAVPRSTRLDSVFALDEVLMHLS